MTPGEGTRPAKRGVASFLTHPADMHPAPALAATRRTARAHGEAERNLGLPHPMTPRPNGANGEHTYPVPCALSGHRSRYVAWSPGFHPVLAFTCCPFGAGIR
jgi:hypothetical protein